MGKLFVAVVSLAIAAPCLAGEQQSCASLTAVQWLPGDWSADGDKNTFHESWKVRGPATYEGVGVERSKADGSTRSSEDLRLMEMGGGVFYVSKVAHNDLPVAFRLTACEGGRFVFENPDHDFPRRIEYLHGADGRLSVRVSDGAGKGFTIDFTRVPESAATDAVLTAEDARFRAMVQGDTEGMRRWLADNLVYVHSTGAVEDREQLIASITSGRMRYLAVEPVERRVIHSGTDSATVQGLARLRVMAGSTPLEFQARYLAVYSLYESAWRLHAWQSLRLP